MNMRNPDPIREALGQEIDALKQRNAALASALDGIISYCIGYGGHMAVVIIDKARAALAQEGVLFTPHIKDIDDHA